MSQINLKIAKTALTVRNWCELNFSKYKSFPDTLNGMCAIASADIHRRLKKQGVHSKICVAETEDGFCHCYSMVDDLLIDVTASQFHMDIKRPLKRVLIGKYPDIVNKYGRHWFWETWLTFNDANSLRIWQRKTNWPKSQIALMSLAS